MQRVPEPAELMDEAEQALAYAQADFSEANCLFLEQFAILYPHEFTGVALDLGCGPADIVLRFLRRYPRARVDAIDGAPEMLKQAHQATPAKLASRVHYQCRCLPDPHLPEHAYDALLSNSLLHHLRDPLVLWHTLKACGKPGALVQIMDLLRPHDEEQLIGLVQRYASDAPEVLRRDFTHSLRAAYSLEEVEQQLKTVGLEALSVSQISDRHLCIKGFLP